MIPAFQPHATSKLAEADDLFRVRTLGFRGEALAAIAEIAKVRCQTRHAEAAEGSELSIEGGIFGPVKKCGCPCGTVVEVRNLFYNIPVRRTFLKSDMTESGHVADMFSRIALAHPEVHLTYRSGNKMVYDLPPVPGTRERIATFFGRELAESLLWVEGQLDSMQLWGYVAHPSQSRSSAKGQFLFIGGRYVRDRSLSHALNEAYRGLLMVGRMPVAFLHLEIPADEVDVNVHPTKVEVRFRDSQRVYSHLLSTLRQTFLKSDLHARLQATSEPAAAESARVGAGATATARHGLRRRHGCTLWFQRRAARAGRRHRTTARRLRRGSSRAAPSHASPNRSVQPSHRLGLNRCLWRFRSGRVRRSTNSPRPPRRPTRLRHAAIRRPSTLPASKAERTSPPPTDQDSTARLQLRWQGIILDRSKPGNRWNRTTVPSAARRQRHRPRTLQKAIQVHDSYLIAETGDGMMVIDQHALHERILYEELRSAWRRGESSRSGFWSPSRWT